MKIGFSRKHLVIPYALFLVLFVILPLLLIVYYAFTNELGRFTFENFTKFFSETTSITTLFKSLGIGALTTIFCILIGYPVAYILSNSKYNKSLILVMLFIMPMWINFVLRTSATRELLVLIGLAGQQYGFFNTMVGMVYNFLPFMILPLYTTMLKMDKSVLEAASDLGASPSQVFVKAVIPLSMPGIVSGTTMVFMPTITCYVISDILSERSFDLLGNLIERNFNHGQLNYGSAIALLMLLIIGISMLITSKFGKAEVSRGGGLW